MTVYVLLAVEEDDLPQLISTLVDSSIRFTVAKDPKNLCFDPVKESCCSPKQQACKSPLEPELEKTPKVEVEEASEDSSHVEVGGDLLKMPCFSSSDFPACLEPSTSREHEDNLVEFDSHPPAKKAKLPQRQCQMCFQWITSKNLRAHAGTHMALTRLKCSACDKTFARMHRGVAHIEQCHDSDPSAQIQRAVTEEQNAVLDELRKKCFPPMCTCSNDCNCK